MSVSSPPQVCCVPPEGVISRLPTPHFTPPHSPPPAPQAALLVLSAALEAAPQVLAPHGPALAALCRGALAPGVPPSPPAYSLQALGGLGAMLGDTHTVSGAGCRGGFPPKMAVSSVSSPLPPR